MIYVNENSKMYKLKVIYLSFSSTRVSNELGAGHPEAARLAVWVVTVLAVLEVLIASIILLCCRSILGYAFGEEKEVVDYVKDMTPLLCFSIIVDCLHAIFCGYYLSSLLVHHFLQANCSCFVDKHLGIPKKEHCILAASYK